MNTLNKFIFFIIVYNLIFLLIMNLQYTYRFGRVNDFQLFSILLITSSIIPFVCFSLSWLVLNKFIKQNFLFKSPLLFLIIVVSSFIFMQMFSHDYLFSLFTAISTFLTLLLYFYRYRENDGYRKI